MKESKYGYAVARTRVWENSLLDQARLERLAGAGSFEEAVAQLADTIYHEPLGKLESSLDYEQAFEEVLVLIYQEMDDMGHGEEFETLLWRYDLANLKLLLRAKLKATGPRRLSALGTTSLDAGPLQDAVGEALRSSDPQQIDLILDQAFFKAALAASKNSFLRGWWQLEIDLSNLRTFLRLSVFDPELELWQKARLAGGGLEPVWEDATFDLDALGAALQKTKFAELFEESVRDFEAKKAWTLLEKLADHYRLDYLRRAKYIPFGPEPLLAYFLAREHEIKLLRIILAGKLNKLEVAEIQERLREVYG